MAINPAPMGEHVLLDLTGATRLDDAAYLREVMLHAAAEAGARVIADHFHKFGEGQGVTGMVMLAESHISVHTWPERQYAAFDIFMCGSARIGRAVDVIRRSFPANHVTIKAIPRG